MVIEVEIELGSDRGSVRYFESAKRVEVTFPVVPIQNTVIDYLGKEREFLIPESQQIDDVRIDTALPTENRTYFELAMCSLWSNTGVMVDWPTETHEEE